MGERKQEHTEMMAHRAGEMQSHTKDGTVDDHPVKLHVAGKVCQTKEIVQPPHRWSDGICR